MNRRTFLSHLTAGAVIAALQPMMSLALPQNSVFTLPFPVQEIYPVFLNGQIYLGGGLWTQSKEKAVLAHLSLDKAIYSLDPLTGQWQTAPALPVSRHHLGLVSHNRALYGIGGFAADKKNGWQVKADVHQLVDNRWQAITPLPIAMGESCYASVGNQIHVIGGRAIAANGQLTDCNHHFVLDDSGQWQSAHPISVARNSAASAVIDNQIYLISGRVHGRQHQSQATFERYDPSTDRWHSLRPYPKPAAGLAALAYKQHIFVFGGEHRNQQGQWRCFDDIYCYQVATDRWTRVGSMQTSRHGLGAVLVNGQAWLLGGAIGPGIEGTSDLIEMIDLQQWIS